MSSDTATILKMPTTFSLAYANTVTSSSINRSFTTRTFADMVAAERALDQAVVDGLAKQYAADKELNNAIKRQRPIVYLGRFPDAARTRNKDNIEAVTALGWDFDGRAGDRVTMTELIDRCRELNLEVVAYETFSADDNGTTFRAIFPLQTELAVDTYGGANTLLKNLIGFGPGTFLPSTQGYFVSPRPGRKGVVKALFGTPCDQLLDFFLLEATADAVAPQGGFQERTTFDPLDHAFNDTEKALYLRCLQITNPYSGDRGHWIKIIGVGLRGWGFTSQILCDPELQNESHKAQLTRLDEWSKAERLPTGATSKYTPGCVISEGRKLFASGAKMAGLAAIVKLAHDDSPDGLIAEIEDDELKALALRKLDIKPEPAATQATFEELASATTERQAKAEKALALSERQALAIHNMPANFGRMRDWCVEFASKGELTHHAQLTDDYRFKIDPISSILCVAQLCSIILGGRVWVDQNHAEFPPTQLNTYVLRIAGSGTGKSISISWMKGILGNTAHKSSMVTNMSFSSGGFWPATFDKLGYNVFQLTDEGATLIAPHVGNLGANLKTLHDLLLTAYSCGHERGELEPPLYSTGGKSNAKSGNSFEPVREPNLNLQAIGTHEIVPLMSTPEFLQSGFSARFIVRIEPKVSEEGEEDVRARHLRSCFDESIDGAASSEVSPILKAQEVFSRHLTGLDTELDSIGRGASLSDLVLATQFDDDAPPPMSSAAYKLASIQRQAEPRGSQYIRKNLVCGEVATEAELFFTPFVKDNELLAAVKHREVEKLTKLAAIYTLARTPDAKYIDADMMRYLMHVLQMAQLDYLSVDVSAPGVPPRWVNEIAKLRREVEPGGILFEAGPDGVSANALRNNRSWRRLLADLQLTDDDLKGARSQAKQVMHDLGVIERKHGKGMFYTMVSK